MAIRFTQTTTLRRTRHAGRVGARAPAQRAQREARQLVQPGVEGPGVWRPVGVNQAPPKGEEPAQQRWCLARGEHGAQGRGAGRPDNGSQLKKVKPRVPASVVLD